MKTIQKFRFATLLSVGLIFSLPAQAANYADLLKNVLDTQPEQAALQGFDALENTANQAASSWFSGNTNLIFAHENDAFTGDLDKQKWQIGAEMPLWLPGQVQSQQALAQGFSELKTNQASYLKWQASGQLRDLVWQFREAQVKTNIAEQSVEQAKSLQKLIQVLVNVGEKPKLDGLLADKALLEAQSHLFAMNTELKASQNRYQYWTKTNELPSPILESLATYDLQNHPQLNQLKAQLTVLNAEYQNLKSTQKDNPVLSFGGFQEDDKGMPANSSLYAQISYPIGSSPTAKVATAQHKSTVLAKEAELKRYQLELQSQLFEAKQQVEASQKKVELIEQEMVISIQALTLAKQAYRIGESNIQTLMNAQQQFLNSKLKQALTQIELNKAIARHNQIAGVSL
ncbi:MAG TPA: hypothetical protein ENK73_02260 [Thiomicrospira sp.]|jgi:hypothetical protein|nr:hypothetical protein [Thiomicrospira sp.]